MLPGTVSPGLLVQCRLSLHRDPQGSAVGVALLRLDTHFLATAVKALRRLQPLQGQQPRLSVLSRLLPQRGRVWGKGMRGERRSRSGYFLQRPPRPPPCFLLSQLNDICASCSQREFLQRNVMGFSMNDPSPPFVSLPAASHPTLKWLFYFERTPP